MGASCIQLRCLLQSLRLSAVWLYWLCTLAFSFSCCCTCILALHRSFVRKQLLVKFLYLQMLFSPYCKCVNSHTMNAFVKPCVECISTAYICTVQAMLCVSSKCCIQGLNHMRRDNRVKLSGCMFTIYICIFCFCVVSTWAVLEVGWFPCCTLSDACSVTVNQESVAVKRCLFGW